MKLFALVVFSVLPATFAVATGKSKSAEGALANDKAASPWLSLLAKSWALPGEAQDEQSKGLDDLANSVLALAKNRKSGAPDAEMKAAVDSISQILSDMKDAVTAGNTAAQQEIDKKESAVKNCSIPSETSTADFEASLRITVKDVLTCRTEEKSYYDAYQFCLAEEARCSNTTECCVDLIQPNPYCLSPPSPPSPLSFQTECDAASRCREKDLENKLAYFEHKLQEYNDAVVACEQSRLGCNASYACAVQEAAWKEKHSQCNGNQTTFEQAYCDLAGSQETHWDTYSGCHDRNVNALETEEAKQESLLTGRRQEWRGLLRIECLLGALTAADQATALDACIKKNHTTAAQEELKLTYPTKTDTVPAKSTCSEKLNAPGTAHFLKTFYSGVPEVLMPTSLTTYYCVSGLSTSNCPVASASMSLLAKVNGRRPMVPHIK